MRIHLRRILLLLWRVLIFLVLAAFIDSKINFLSYIKKGIIVISFQRGETRAGSKDIQWKKENPLWKMPFKTNPVHYIKGVLNYNSSLRVSEDFSKEYATRPIFWTKDSGVRRRSSSFKLPADMHGIRLRNFNNSSFRAANLNVKSNDSIRITSHRDHGQNVLVPSEKNYFNMNTTLSDVIPLNRDVPDSRPDGCSKMTYPDQLPTVSVVIPFYNEWPSVLMRTVHSLVNRTPRRLLKKIILVDDASDLNSLKTRVSNYVKWTFPEDLLKIVRLSSRQGLIRARLEGFKYVTTEAMSFFDSHMEVNKDWLPPLLHEIKKNRKTVAMAQLDYINKENFTYEFYKHYRTRYGFKWDMEFFETYFRPDQLQGKAETDPLPGVIMVGAGFVIDTQYFKELGMYDDAMKVWGGENIEFAWRTWMCGGQLLHVPCSHIGHLERTQPYSFPGGRPRIEMFNYKRAAEVWMGPYKKYVYAAIAHIRDVDQGNLTGRLNIKKRLKCQDFNWFLGNIWPELLPYNDVGELWGQIKSAQEDACLDNDDYVFQDAVQLRWKPCVDHILKQGFSLTDAGQLRTTLHCVIVRYQESDVTPFIGDCFLYNASTWFYQKDGHLVHGNSQQCLQVMPQGKLSMRPCHSDLSGQRWEFKPDLWLRHLQSVDNVLKSL